MTTAPNAAVDTATDAGRTKARASFMADAQNLTDADLAKCVVNLASAALEDAEDTVRLAHLVHGAKTAEVKQAAATAKAASTQFYNLQAQMPATRAARLDVLGCIWDANFKTIQKYNSLREQAVKQGVLNHEHGTPKPPRA